MEKRFFDLHVAGCTRRLEIMNISDTTAIASFVILGDVDLVVKAAGELVKSVPDADLIMTAEAKGIPLAEEMARQMGQARYIVARKSVKGYMAHPLIVKDRSITTKGEQILCLQDDDIERVKGKRVLLVDDVISTGESIAALEKLATLAGAEIAGKAAILAEGDAIKRKDIIVLGGLPLFPAIQSQEDD